LVEAAASKAVERRIQNLAAPTLSEFGAGKA
jgi:hypothetical protein